MSRATWGTVMRRAVLGDEPPDPRLLEKALAEIGAELSAPVSWPALVFGAPRSGVRRVGETDLDWMEAG